MYRLIWGHFIEKNGKINVKKELKRYCFKEIENLPATMNSFRILQIKGNLNDLLRYIFVSKYTSPNSTCEIKLPCFFFLHLYSIENSH